MALTVRPTAEAKAQAWRDAVERDDVANETMRQIAYAFPTAGQEELLAPYLEKYLSMAETVWDEKGTQRASTVLEYMFPRPLDLGGDPGPPGHLAGVLGGQPGREALRA